VGIAAVLRAELDDPRTSFVFPTEVAARFWLRRALDFSRPRVLRGDRFLSWDQFDRLALDYGGEAATPPRRRAGVAERTLFAASLLEANRRRGLLRELVPPDAEPLAFLPALRDLLPCLHEAERLSGRWPASSQGKRADLSLLAGEYRGYLRRAGLYEPAFQRPELRQDGRRYRLFYPEALEEFPGVERSLASTGRVAVLRLGPPERVPPIRAFADSLQEMAWALASIAALLDRGVEAGDIALTVGDLPTLEPHLRRQAAILEVPLGIRLRRPLAELPPCRAFERIRTCLDSGFSLGALRDLLLDGSLPWRNPERGQALVELGSEQRVVKNLPGADAWQRALRRAGELEKGIGGLRAYYRKLTATLERIAAAPDFRRLKEELTAFSKSLLDPSDWSKEELAAWQFALDTLDDLEEARAAEGELPAAPFRLWLRFLADARYGLPVPEAGVNTYGYGVSAGISPAHHFVIGASQAATRWVVKKLPGLGSHEEAALGEMEHDLSDTRLALYTLSGAEVSFSFARRGFQSSHLPPGFFVAARAVGEAEPPPPHPDALEERLWRGGPEPEGAPSALRQAGFRQALRCLLAPKTLDLTRSRLARPDLLERALAGLRDPEGLLGVSPTGLQLFRQCPFGFLLERLLGLEKREFSPVAVEPLEFGSLMHRVLQRFHERVRRLEPQASLDPVRRETYRRWLAGIVRRVFRAWREPTPVAPAWRAAQSRAVELALAFLDRDLEELPGARVLATERFLRDPRPEAGLVLRGAIDRISELGDGYLVTDYKKKGIPTAAQIIGERPVSFQMPFYLALMRAAGLPVRSAAYYSIEEARYVWVTGGRRPMADGQAMEVALGRLERAAAEMAAALRAGDFTVPRACPSCGQRGICRARFALREDHGHPLR
jgi:ATP-dependent helicase/nuclease subunit B